MDEKTPAGDATERALKPARTALSVLALCYVLQMVGRGLGDSFTVFLKPIAESFSWDRAEVVSVYSLTWLAGGLMAPLVGRLFDRSGPRLTYSLGLCCSEALSWLHRARRRSGSSSFRQDCVSESALH